MWLKAAEEIQLGNLESNNECICMPGIEETGYFLQG